jgi:hypothetical protein
MKKSQQIYVEMRHSGPVYEKLTDAQIRTAIRTAEDVILDKSRWEDVGDNKSKMAVTGQFEMKTQPGEFPDKDLYRKAFENSLDRYLGRSSAFTGNPDDEKSKIKSKKEYRAGRYSESSWNEYEIPNKYLEQARGTINKERGEVVPTQVEETLMGAAARKDR